MRPPLADGGRILRQGFHSLTTGSAIDHATHNANASSFTTQGDRQMGNTGNTHAGFSDQAQLDTSQVEDLRGGGGRFGGVPGGRMTISGGGVGLVVVLLALVFGLDVSGGGNGLGSLSGLNDRTIGSGSSSASSTLVASCKTGAEANQRQDCRVVG
jgi:hypothetical protein